MAPLIWQDEFNINVARIDEQHRKMLSLAQALHAAVSAGGDRTQLLNQLASLTGFTRMHFAFEEALMTEHGYPDLEAHRQEHASLLQRLEVLRQALEQGRPLQLAPSIEISDDWVLSHVDGADRKLGEFLNQRHVF